MTLTSSPAEEAAVCDFLVQLAADIESRGALPLADYLARFPDHQIAVAREYLGQLQLTIPGNSPAVAPAPASAQRYLVHGEIARGGMGTVLRVRDGELDRELAMKVHHRLDERSLRRFMAEARITGLLDHPGVVPVHDIGTTQDGRAYFTMRLIHGVTLREVIDRHHHGDPAWTQPRVLDVMAKVCDAVAYAHARGIVHRDLKPANVMVGEFGEVYVVDWGLARLVDADDPHDLRVRVVDTAGAPAEAPLCTMDGDVVGTPSYMAPEQAQGRVGELGPTADVYSAGAILYHLLAGRPPYAVPGTSATSRQILQRVRDGSLAPPESLRPGLPRELVAICDKAMHRDAGRRYPDMRAMATDLRAFLELRVVAAHRVGAWARTVKWLRRNRALSAALAAALLIAVVAAAATWSQARARSRMLRLLADAITPTEIERRFQALWPLDPHRAPQLSALIDEAQLIVSRRADYANELAALRGRALPMDPDAPAETRFRKHAELAPRMHAELADRMEQTLRDAAAGTDVLPDRATPELLRAQIAELRERSASTKTFAVPHLTFRFADPVHQVLFEALGQLAPAIDRLTATGPTVGFLPIARASLDLLHAAQQHLPADFDERWREAIASIGDVTRCPMYAGLQLPRHDTLLPIGRDPDSGLWEFAHLLSGAPATRDRHGRLVLTDDTGIVLVLIPAGAARMGSQVDPRDGYHADPWADPDTNVLTPFRIQAFLFGKHEVTQAQWRRLTTRNPSRLTPPAEPSDPQADPTCTWQHPVECVSYIEAENTLHRVGLRPPTEMQWEYADRAGTDTVWPTGDDPQSILGFGNVADLSALDIEAIHQRGQCPTDLDDGFPRHAPVAAQRANRFGLHGMIGNVAEWCRDRGPVSYDRAMVDFISGERTGDGDGTRPIRGGSFLLSVLSARSAARRHAGVEFRDRDVGVRASREIDP